MLIVSNLLAISVSNRQEDCIFAAEMTVLIFEASLHLVCFLWASNRLAALLIVVHGNRTPCVITHLNNLHCISDYAVR